MKISNWFASIARRSLPESAWRESSLTEEEMGSIGNLLLMSLALHFIAAYFSVGYHSADEHFQILEFMNYRLGRTPIGLLAVEYSERMRPWLQPGIYWLMAKTWLGLGVDNPFTWAWSFRIFSGLVGWLSLVGLSLCSLQWFKSRADRRLVAMASSLLWFLPALHVRPSSESLAGSAFLVGLTWFYLAWQRGRERGVEGFVAGIILGASFEFRFQMGLMIAGALAWGLWIARARIGAVIAGLGVVFCVGRFVDRWGYGEWVLSPWNYVSYNLIRGEVNHYGRAPWWDVFRMAMTESWPLLGFLLAIAVVIAWLRNPRHVLTWSQAPFFFVHEWIAHKELRFFFPIASAAPALLGMALAGWDRRQAGWRHAQKIGRALVVLNAVALIALCLVPFARTVQFYEGVSREIPRELQGRPGSFELFIRGRDPYEILGTDIYFYRPPELRVRRFTKDEEVIAAARIHPVWLFHNQFSLGGSLAGCRKVFGTLPEWVQSLNFGGWLERTNIWTLWKCVPGDTFPSL